MLTLYPQHLAEDLKQSLQVARSLNSRRGGSGVAFGLLRATAKTPCLACFYNPLVIVGQLSL